MSLLPFDRHPSGRKLRQFAGCLTVVAAALLVQALRAGREIDPFTAGSLGFCLLGIGGLLKPALCRPVYLALAVITFPFGWVISWVLLGLVFYGLFLPIGLLLRLAGRDPLQRRRAKNAASYWTPVRRPRKMESYFSQF